MVSRYANHIYRLWLLLLLYRFIPYINRIHQIEAREIFSFQFSMNFLVPGTCASILNVTKSRMLHSFYHLNFSRDCRQNHTVIPFIKNSVWESTTSNGKPTVLFMNIRKKLQLFIRKCTCKCALTQWNTAAESELKIER